MGEEMIMGAESCSFLRFPSKQLGGMMPACLCCGDMHNDVDIRYSLTLA